MMQVRDHGWFGELLRQVFVNGGSAGGRRSTGSGISGMRRTSPDPIAAVKSHGVLVCPGFECNSRMEYDALTMSMTCVYGHTWTDEQVYRGNLRRPWRTGWKPVYERASVLVGRPRTEGAVIH